MSGASGQLNMGCPNGYSARPQDPGTCAAGEAAIVRDGRRSRLPVDCERPDRRGRLGRMVTSNSRIEHPRPKPTTVANVGNAPDHRTCQARRAANVRDGGRVRPPVDRGRSDRRGRQGRMATANGRIERRRPVLSTAANVGKAPDPGTCAAGGAANVRDRRRDRPPIDCERPDRAGRRGRTTTANGPIERGRPEPSTVANVGRAEDHGNCEAGGAANVRDGRRSRSAGWRPVPHRTDSLQHPAHASR